MPADKSQLFSKEALDKLRSPEKLDTLLAITTPITWMALIAILALLFSVVLWSIYGAFTVKADGMGLIMDSAGVMNISHVASRKNRGGRRTDRHEVIKMQVGITVATVNEDGTGAGPTRSYKYVNRGFAAIAPYGAAGTLPYVKIYQYPEDDEEGATPVQITSFAQWADIIGRALISLSTDRYRDTTITANWSTTEELNA